MSYELKVAASEGTVKVWLEGYVRYETDLGGMHWSWTPKWTAYPPCLLVRLNGDTFAARVARVKRKVLRLKLRLEAADALAENAISDCALDQKTAEQARTASRKVRHD